MFMEKLSLLFEGDLWHGEEILLFDWEGWHIATFETWEDIPEEWMECAVMDAQLCEDSTGKPYWDVMLEDVEA